MIFFISYIFIANNHDFTQTKTPLSGRFGSFYSSHKMDRAIIQTN